MSAPRYGVWLLIVIVAVGALAMLQGCSSSGAGYFEVDGSTTHFLQMYGDKNYVSSWLAGVIAIDTITISGKQAVGQRFGLMQVGNVAIANPFGRRPNVADGIIGLQEGSMHHGDSVKTDLLSTLLGNKVISAHAFTLCLKDNEAGGGMFYLGRPNGQVTSDMREYKLVANTQDYAIAVDSGSGNIKAYLGPVGSDTKIGETTTDDWNRGYLDTATNGLQMPRNVYESMCNKLTQRMWENQDIKTAFGGVQDNLHNFLCLYTSSTPVWEVQLSAKEAGVMKGLVPDLNIQLPDGNIVTVYGSSFLYAISPGSYMFSWTPQQTESEKHWVLGSAFNWGQTLFHDRSANKLISYGKAGECETDFSEAGIQPIETTGDPAQVLGPGCAINIEIELGTPGQKFVMYLDSGSAKMILNDRGCMMVGRALPEDQMDQREVPDACLALAETEDPNKAQVQKYTFQDPNRKSECEIYYSDFESKLKESNLDWNMDVEIATLMPMMSETLKPYATCSAKRKQCNLLNEFVKDDSSSIQTQDLPTYSWTHAPPQYNNKQLECGR